METPESESGEALRVLRDSFQLRREVARGHLLDPQAVLETWSTGSGRQSP
jgi:hypothetical protein